MKYSTYKESNHFLDLKINSQLDQFLLKILLMIFQVHAFELQIFLGSLHTQ